MDGHAFDAPKWRIGLLLVNTVHDLVEIEFPCTLYNSCAVVFTNYHYSFQECNEYDIMYTYAHL